jgi:hypothetical protein
MIPGARAVWTTVGTPSASRRQAVLRELPGGASKKAHTAREGDTTTAPAPHAPPDSSLRGTAQADSGRSMTRVTAFSTQSRSTSSTRLGPRSGGRAYEPGLSWWGSRWSAGGRALGGRCLLVYQRTSTTEDWLLRPGGYRGCKRSICASGSDIVNVRVR